MSKGCLGKFRIFHLWHIDALGPCGPTFLFLLLVHVWDAFISFSLNGKL